MQLQYDAHVELRAVGLFIRATGAGAVSSCARRAGCRARVLLPILRLTLTPTICRPQESGFVNQDQPIKDLLLQTTVLDMGLVAIAIPGYFTAVLLIDRWGRRRLQLIGFAAMAVLYIGMGVWMDALRSSKTLFIIVYGLTFFFSNAGPNTTTFVLPSESFPTAIRATCHGISAATGKLGAVVGGILLRPLQQAAGLEVVMIVCGCVALSGLALTWWLVEETMGRSLEAITHEAPAVDEGGDEIQLALAMESGTMSVQPIQLDDVLVQQKQDSDKQNRCVSIASGGFQHEYRSDVGHLARHTAHYATFAK